jgi:hypothetical protein
MSRLARQLGIAAVLITLLTATVPVTAQSMVPPGQQYLFRVEAAGGQDWRGRPVVSGYVYNDYGRAAAHVRLQVEVLDASGTVLSRTLAYEDSIVPNFNRAYFEARVPALGASYRVTVVNAEFLGGGGGGGGM